jgi:hypothetical protein
MYTVKSEYGKIQDFEDQQVAIDFSAKIALTHPDTKFFVEDSTGKVVYKADVTRESLDPEYANKCIPFNEVYRSTGKLLSASPAIYAALKPFLLRGLPDQPHPDEVN